MIIRIKLFHTLRKSGHIFHQIQRLESYVNWIKFPGVRFQTVIHFGEINPEVLNLIYSWSLPLTSGQTNPRHTTEISMEIMKICPPSWANPSWILTEDKNLWRQMLQKNRRRCIKAPRHVSYLSCQSHELHFLLEIILLMQTCSFFVCFVWAAVVVVVSVVGYTSGPDDSKLILKTNYTKIFWPSAPTTNNSRHFIWLCYY